MNGPYCCFMIYYFSFSDSSPDTNNFVCHTTVRHVDACSNNCPEKAEIKDM